MTDTGTTAKPLALPERRKRAIQTGQRISAAQVAVGAIWAMAFISLLSFPSYTAANDLDASWSQAYGHFLAHGFQAGVDYVFTFGPLGYFFTQAFQPELFWQAYIWQLATKLLLVWNLCRISRDIENRWARAALAIFTLILLPCAPAQDSFYFVLIVSGGMVLARSERASRVLIAANIAALAACSLVKFTFFTLAAVMVIAAAVSNGRRGAWYLAGYCVAFLISWVLSGQAVYHIPAYLSTSAAVAAGYGAMALPGEPALVWLGASFLLVISASFFLGIRFDRKGMASAFALLIAILLSWKQGFVRQDSAHVCLFFIQASLIGLLSLAKSDSSRRPGKHKAFLVCGAGLLGILGLWLSLPAGRQASIITDHLTIRTAKNLLAAEMPQREFTRLGEERRRLALEWHLTKISRMVGDEPVDVISFQQGIALLNGLNYRPRPVIQSYAAFTPELSRMNSDFVARSRPKYMLYSLESIDDRLPTLDDSLSLLQMVYGYQPAVTEKGLVLLRRRTKSKGVPAQIGVVSTTAEMGQEIAVPSSDGLRVAKVFFRNTPLGTVESAALRPRNLWIVVRLENGKTRRFRLIPAMARTGFLLSPLPMTTEEAVNLSLGKPCSKVVSFRIEQSAGRWQAYQSSFGCAIRSLPTPGRTPTP